MGRPDRKLRIGVAGGLLVGLGLFVSLRDAARPPSHPAPPAVSDVSGAPPAAGVGPDLGRLYDLDLLVLGEPVPLPPLPRHDAFRAGPAGGAPVPEPGVAVLWILGIASVWTLYVPARSW